MDKSERERLRALCEAATPGPECTGITAQWCPRCGDCTCPDGTPADCPLCPLHARGSSHGEDEEHGPDAAAAALDRERRMLLALETGPSAEAFDAPSGAPCLRCGGGAYAVACPLCSPAGDR